MAVDIWAAPSEFSVELSPQLDVLDRLADDGRLLEILDVLFGDTFSVSQLFELSLVIES